MPGYRMQGFDWMPGKKEWLIFASPFIMFH